MSTEPGELHTNTYYTDNQVASQTQNEQTVGYKLDPAGRTLETISTGKPNNSTVVSHYTGPGNAPAWTINPVSSEWRRNITGISGSLVAIQNNGETPELQINNLHGDIIAKAYLSETATELAAKADTSEYGVPTVTAPAKYSWLGAIELPTELPSGVTTMGVRSYVPQIGRFLQPDPIPGGSADAYSYTFGDPVNSSDPTGDYVEGGYLTAVNDKQNKEAVEREEAREAAARAAREAAARAAAEQAAREAAEAAAAAAGPQYAEWEEWEEWYEEEGGYEDIASRGKSGSEEHHLESAILVQPLSAGATSGSENGLGATPLCNGGAEGPCIGDVIAGSPCIPSGCTRSKRRERNGGGIQTACEYVGGAIGGVAGGLLGSLIGGPEAGGVAGGVAGGAFGTYSGHEYCK